MFKSFHDNQFAKKHGFNLLNNWPNEIYFENYWVEFCDVL